MNLLARDERTAKHYAKSRCLAWQCVNYIAGREELLRVSGGIIYVHSSAFERMDWPELKDTIIEQGLAFTHVG